MQLTSARKIASKGVVGPQELGVYHSAKNQIRKARKRRRTNKRLNQRHA